MSKAIFFLVMIVFSFSQAGICLAEQTSSRTKVLEKLGEVLFGEEEKAGTLNVDSEPRSASVFVDNVLRGKTPCSLDNRFDKRLAFRHQRTRSRHHVLRQGERATRDH